MANSFQVVIDAARPREARRVLVRSTRLHLDVHVDPDSLCSRAEELVALGVTIVGEFDEPEGRWITLLDPEGNEFCVNQRCGSGTPREVPDSGSP